MVTQDSDVWRDDGSPPRWGCTAAFISLILVVAGGIMAWYYFRGMSRAEAAVTASSGRLTLAVDDGDHRRAFDRRSAPEIWYRVQLGNVPLGQKLNLVCEWFDAQGRVAHRNQYQTKTITHSPWETHARCRISPASPVGQWRARLLLGGRQLHQVSFEVRDGVAAPGDAPLELE